MQFTKVHGLGNDFVLVNCLQNEELPSDLSVLGRQICHRYFGIGADGLVLLLPSKVADVRMQIINSDGSEAEMCGNVIRCVAKYLYEHKLIIKEKITVETLAGIMKPELILDSKGVKLVKVDMGEPKLERSQIPVLGTGDKLINEPITIGKEIYHVTGVSLGNPHCVIFVPDVDAVSLQTIGPKIECHPMFPKKTNVEFVQVLNRQEVRMNVWERGAGATMACGTGSCATLVASVLNNQTDKKVTVHLYAGDLIIEWGEDNHLYMTGPATEVYSGNINII